MRMDRLFISPGTRYGVLNVTTVCAEVVTSAANQ